MKLRISVLCKTQFTMFIWFVPFIKLYRNSCLQADRTMRRRNILQFQSTKKKCNTEVARSQEREETPQPPLLDLTTAPSLLKYTHTVKGKRRVFWSVFQQWYTPYCWHMELLSPANHFKVIYSLLNNTVFMPKGKLHVLTNEGIHYLNAHLKKQNKRFLLENRLV